MSAGVAQDRLGRGLTIAASVVVVATVVVAIAVMGSPAAQREAKLDSRRVDDLNQIVQTVDQYVEAHDALPPDLVTLARQPGMRLSITDPVDGTPYTYEVTGERSFRLCAVFVTDTSEIQAVAGPWVAEDWNHDAGPQCFIRKAREAADDK